MPLNPNEKTAVALRLVAARCLDPLCSDVESECRNDFRDGACGLLRQHASEAQSKVTRDDDIPPYILEGIDKLERYTAKRADISDSLRILGQYATDLLGQTGDGIVWGQHIGPQSCQAGLLELAHHIECKVRDRIGELGIDLNSRPTIRFTTSLAGARSCQTSKVKGSTDIARSPRAIDLVVVNADLDAADVLKIAYVIYRELVCHAFRAALADTQFENAQNKCFWAEGWMDAVAFDLAVEWVEDGPSTWLPLRDEDGIAPIRAAHDGRFTEEPGLLKYEMTKRRNARNAYRRLATAMRSVGFANCDEAARRLVEQFSWSLQTHATASPAKIRDIVERISRVVSNKARLDEQLIVVKACLNFSRSHDCDALDQAIPPL